MDIDSSLVEKLIVFVEFEEEDEVEADGELWSAEGSHLFGEAGRELGFVLVLEEDRQAESIVFE